MGVTAISTESSHRVGMSERLPLLEFMAPEEPEEGPASLQKQASLTVIHPGHRCYSGLLDTPHESCALHGVVGLQHPPEYSN